MYPSKVLTKVLRKRFRAFSAFRRYSQQRTAERGAELAWDRVFNILLSGVASERKTAIIGAVT
jgi:hypothetical protein